MKNLLLIPLILLSFYVFADERVFLGSFEQESTEAEEGVVDAESSLSGFGARLFNFKDSGLFYGLSFAHLTGDSDLCALSVCVSLDSTGTLFSGEIGRDLGQWIPFVGTTFYSAEVEAFGESESDESWGLNAGLWLELDTFKLRATINDIDDSDSRSITGGLLFQMDNDFAFGAEVGMLLDDEVDGFRISLQIGKVF